MPTKDSQIIAVRVKNDIASKIDERINSPYFVKMAEKLKLKKPTRNMWFNWLIKVGLRKHDKKEG